MNRRRVSLGKRFRVISVAGGMPERQVSSRAPRKEEEERRGRGRASERASHRVRRGGEGRGGEDVTRGYVATASQ